MGNSEAFRNCFASPPYQKHDMNPLALGLTCADLCTRKTSRSWTIDEEKRVLNSNCIQIVELSSPRSPFSPRPEQACRINRNTVNLRPTYDVDAMAALSSRRPNTSLKRRGSTRAGATEAKLQSRLAGINDTIMEQ